MNTQRKKNFVCTECNKCFIDNAHLKEHVIKHTKEKLFVCNICNKKFARSGSLRVHTRSHTEKSQEYICPYDDCSRKYSSRTGFIYHQRKHNEKQNLPDKVSLPMPAQCTLEQTQSKALRCSFPDCNMSFISEPVLHNHIYSYHVQVDSNSCSKAQCIQMRKDFLQQQLYIQKLHKRIQELEALLLPFSMEEGSPNHNIPVIPEVYLKEEKPFVCGIPECSQRFSTCKLLQFHSKVHSSVPLETVLNNQLRIPSGPVFCPVSGCEYGIGQKPMASFFVLRRHYQRVHLKKNQALASDTSNDRRPPEENYPQTDCNSLQPSTQAGTQEPKELIPQESFELLSPLEFTTPSLWWNNCYNKHNTLVYKI